jgi:Fe-Mn family superoxide dismutase
MSPNGGGEPEGALKDMIVSAFGSVDNFKAEFKKAAMGRFGSGWAWLVQDGDTVSIQTTANAESPFGTDVTPLLTLDVWEHAYYLDYQNERNTYTDTFLDKLINWEFAAANLQ